MIPSIENGIINKTLISTFSPNQANLVAFSTQYGVANCILH